MELSFFNFSLESGTSGRQRRQGLRAWWRFYRADARWAPPYYPRLSALLRHPYLQRRQPRWYRLEAFTRRRLPGGRRALVLDRGLLASDTSPFPVTVATSLVLPDTVNRDTADLALFRCANDAGVLRRLLASVAEELAPQGIRRLRLPAALSPLLPHGALLDHWHETPPLYAPYHPPYLPDLLAARLAPQDRWRLFTAEIAAGAAGSPTPGPGRLMPFAPARLAGPWRDLMAAALNLPPGRLAPDQADFLLAALGPWPLWGWVALIDQEPAGFVLLQPDLAPVLARTGGGRNLGHRAWLRLLARRPARAGRIVLAGVRPERQRQGIGRQLWQQATAVATRQGWQQISAGPVPEVGPAADWLRARGAIARHGYQSFLAEW